MRRFTSPHRLLTRDPVTGGELLVTRLEGTDSGVVIEGEFSLGWLGRLTPEQVEFVGLLLRNRANVQKLAAELGISYNTARSRLDDVVLALGGPAEPEEPPAPRPDRTEALQRLKDGEISFEEAMRQIKSD